MASTTPITIAAMRRAQAACAEEVMRREQLRAARKDLEAVTFYLGLAQAAVAHDGLGSTAQKALLQIERLVQAVDARLDEYRLPGRGA